jgi:hypothetical protein
MKAEAMNEIEAPAGYAGRHAYAFTVELNGKTETVRIMGASREVARQRLTRTGWFVNSARNIVD